MWIKMRLTTSYNSAQGTTMWNSLYLVFLSGLIVPLNLSHGHYFYIVCPTKTSIKACKRRPMQIYPLIVPAIGFHPSKFIKGFTANVMFLYIIPNNSSFYKTLLMFRTFMKIRLWLHNISCFLLVWKSESPGVPSILPDWLVFYCINPLKFTSMHLGSY